MWGYNKFFRRAMLEKSNYLRDDCLKIYCTVGVVVHSARLCAIQVPYSAPTSTHSCLVKETMSGSNLFVIEGYPMTKSIGDGKYIESDKFWMGGYKWTICFYPEGRDPEDDSTHVAVFIKLASEIRDVQAIFELTLMDQTGKGKHKIAMSSLPKTLRTCGSKWGYLCFFKRAALEMSDYLRDDCLKIYCNVEVIVSAVDRSMIRVPDSDIGLHIGAAALYLHRWVG